MMTKTVKIIFISVLAVFLSVNISFAQTGEQITKFYSVIQVNTDNSITVEETITYDSGGTEKRGIIRSLGKYSSQDRKMNIKVEGVSDESGVPQEYKLFDKKDVIEIRIGNENIYFNGEITYKIKYSATNAIGQFDDFDEIYWNVTGHNWNFPLINIQSDIILPNDIKAKQFACYAGYFGSNNSCFQTNKSENGQIVTFFEPILHPSQELSVAVGFQKGVVPPYAPPRKSNALEMFLKNNWAWTVSLIFLYITFTVYRYWDKNGRDPKGRGTIVAEYDVPEEISPMEAVAIMRQKIAPPSSISAQIIYLATKGYLDIREIDERFIFLKSIDYELTKLKPIDDLPLHDQTLMRGLFVDNPDVVRVSQMRSGLVDQLQNIKSYLAQSLLEKEYYRHLGAMHVDGRHILYGFLIVVIGIILLMAKTSGQLQIYLLLSLSLCAVVTIVVLKISPSKTEKGVALKEHLLGLREYLLIAEKDRLEFHNAPERKPELFEKLLPYAMAFGVADVWMNEFADMYKTPPSWYHSANGAFNIGAFALSMHSFNTMAKSAAGAGGGSGGGGSAGGGGGGGGGGSW